MEVFIKLIMWYFMTTLGPVTVGLLCHLCASADIKEDCYLNEISCSYRHVCFKESIHVTYISHSGLEQHMMTYRMGCRHYTLCRDRVSHGPGDYGYERIRTECCCHKKCEKADGVGVGHLENCPTLWDNYTTEHGRADRNVVNPSSLGLMYTSWTLLYSTIWW